MTERFNPPPNWPEPPRDGWVPPEDWLPRRAWGSVPAGWRLWVQEQPLVDAVSPLQPSEDVPASGARPRARIDAYPVDVLNPGMWSQNHLQDEDYGFPAPKPRRNRPGLRLGMTITATVLGLALAVATVFIFIEARRFAVDDLPGRAASAQVASHFVVDARLPTGSTQPGSMSTSSMGGSSMSMSPTAAGSSPTVGV